MTEDPFDVLSRRVITDRSSVLDYLDHFTIYGYYIDQVFGPTDIKVNDNFRSPLRPDDNNPSFRLYYGREKVLMFCDYGDKRRSGDVLVFVKELFHLSNAEALIKLGEDFGLRDGNSIDVKIPIRKQIIKPKKSLGVQVKQEFSPAGIAFWESFHISPATLKRYNVFEAEYIIWNNLPRVPKELTFAYRIGKHWKIYSPFSREYKFISYYPLNYIEGYMQLEFRKPLLIITKSTKDVMVLAEMGFESISPQSESSVIEDKFLKHLETKYSTIKVLFDNDGKENSHLYPYDKIFLPADTAKDISDYVKEFGLLEGRSLLMDLL